MRAINSTSIKFGIVEVGLIRGYRGGEKNDLRRKTKGVIENEKK